jgi:cation transporter-like permease
MKHYAIDNKGQLRMKTIYYALMLSTSLFMITVFAWLFQAALDGHPITIVLIPVMLYITYFFYDDAMAIIDEEDKL